MDGFYGTFLQVIWRQGAADKVLVPKKGTDAKQVRPQVPALSVHRLL